MQYELISWMILSQMLNIYVCVSECTFQECNLKNKKLLFIEGRVHFEKH